MRMMNPINAAKAALERAFQIARTGHCQSTDDIRRQLQQEGHYQHQVTGPMLDRQLIELARKARVLSTD
jgi:phosphohistidine phosphatase SixA